jgi:Fe2+ or Zn2+ uptake regulation protein
MNIGQFVAAEIIILLVINSVEKIVIGLETLYDVLTSVEKIGLITDMKLEEEFTLDYDNCYTYHRFRS